MSGKVSVKCTYCDTEFVKYANSVGPNNFCNTKCYSQWKIGKPTPPAVKITVVCNGCGISFDKHPYQVRERNYCCRKCQRDHADPIVTVKCTNCGTEISKPHWKVHSKNFCCQECLSAYQRGENHHQYTSVIVNCAQCKTELRRIPAITKTNKKHFCDLDCRNAWHTKNAIGENAPHWQGGKVNVQCAQCGTHIEREKNVMKERKRFFCTNECMSTWNSEHAIGKNAPAWQGGYKKYYGPSWPAQSRLARERDNHTCQHCGKTRDENGRELDVHHITPFRIFGYIPDENDNYLHANQLDNLTSLCRSCHSKQQRKYGS